MGHIYKHTSPSGKAYIGQSVQTPEQRWQGHIYDTMSGSDLVFHRAIRKYGPDTFTHEILHDGIDDLDELDRLEIAAIAEHDTFRNGYNMTPGGDRIEHTPHIRKKMSKALLARWNDTDYKMQRLENVITDEYRAKLSVASKAKWKDPNYRKRFSEGLKATLATPKAKARKSRAMKKVLKDQQKYEARKRQLDEARMSPEEYSELSRRRWADPEWRAKASAAIKEARTPESYEISGAKMKTHWADPTYRERVLAAQKAGVERAKGDGTFKRAAKQSMSRAEVREKIRTSVLAHWTPERRAQQRDLVLNNEKLIRARKSAQARDHFDPVWIAKQGGRPVCIENRYFPSAGLADKLLGLKSQAARHRCDSSSPKWRNWRYFTTRSGDPECDAVEECWAIMCWATENRDHANVPEWMRERLGLPRHGSVPATLWAAE